MMARTSVMSNALLSPARERVKTTSEPSGPRIFSTASCRLIPRTGAPSSLTIISPARMPARCAGVSAIGATTLINPSSATTSIPSPPNRPSVVIRICLNASGSRNAECGSSPASMPLIASRNRVTSSASSTYSLLIAPNTSANTRNSSNGKARSPSRAPCAKTALLHNAAASKPSFNFMLFITVTYSAGFAVWVSITLFAAAYPTPAGGAFRRLSKRRRGTGRCNSGN